MRDIKITISQHRQKVELLTILVCFIIAFALNVYAIIAFDGKWSELFWSLGFVAAATAIFYVLWTIIRVLVWLLKKAFSRKK